MQYVVYSINCENIFQYVMKPGKVHYLAYSVGERSTMRIWATLSDLDYTTNSVFIYGFNVEYGGGDSS